MNDWRDAIDRRQMLGRAALGFGQLALSAMLTEATQREAGGEDCCS